MLNVLEQTGHANDEVARGGGLVEEIDMTTHGWPLRGETSQPRGATFTGDADHVPAVPTDEVVNACIPRKRGGVDPCR